MRYKLGPFLFLIVLGTLVGTASAQDLDHPSDKFGEFEQKLNAARRSSNSGDQGAVLNQPLGENPFGSTGALPHGKTAPVSDAARYSGTKLAQSYRAGHAIDAQDDASTAATLADPYAGMIVADSKVTAVTVFGDRARITRTAAVEVPAGTHTIVFKGLAGFMPETLHVNGHAKANVTFGAVAQKEIFESAGGSRKQEHDKEAQIDDLLDQRALLDVEKDALSRETDFLNNIVQKADDGQGRAASGKDAPPALAIKPEDWGKNTQSLYGRIYDIQKAQQTEDEKKQDINEEITAARVELGQSMPQKRSVRCVTVPVIAEAATRVTVELDYFMSNATWYPLYDARLTMGGDSGLVITQYAMVRQATGEDWNGVALTLSTAQPDRNASQPDLSTVWLDIYKPTEMPVHAYTDTAKEIAGQSVNDPEYIKKVKEQNDKAAKEAMQNGGSAMPRPVAPTENGQLALPAQPAPPAVDPLAEWRAKTEAKRVQMENEQAPEEKEAEQPEVVPLLKPRVMPFAPPERMPLVKVEPPPAAKAVIAAAHIDNGGFASEYKIPGVNTVPSDGTDVKLLVGNFDAESTVEVRIEPQVSDQAYLVVENKLKGDAPMLPGTVNLFRDGAYIGQSTLPLLRPGETHDIVFGIDDQVSAEHKTVRDERSQLGLIAHENGLERSGVTEIQNLHKTPVNIVLKELLPVSRDERLKIDITAEGAMTPGYKLNEENIQGLVSWQFRMAPMEKKEVKFSWKAVWPDNYDVSGL